MITRLFFVIFLVILFTKQANAQIKLTLGQPEKRIEILKRSFQRFYLLASDIPTDLKEDSHILIMVSPYSGETDLFVKNNEYPTDPKICDISNCKNSTNPGGNIVDIKVNERWITGDRVYIGVWAETNALVDITAWVSGSQSNQYPVQIDSDTTQFARTLQDQFTYFSFHLNEDVNFTISASPVFGDPDVYVSTKTTTPNVTNSEWSKLRGGADYLFIGKNDPNYVPNAVYYIGITSFTKFSVFTLSVTKQNHFSPLLDGMPADSFVDRHSFKYFHYYHEERDGEAVDVRFTLEPTTYQGDPDLYIYHQDSGRNGLPTSTNSDYNSRHARGRVDSIYLANAKKGWYYIGVEGFSKTNFELIAASEYAHVNLRLGRPVHYHCNSTKWVYFRHDCGDNENSLTFSVVTKTGKVDMYTSRIPNRKPVNVPGRYEFKGVYRGSSRYVFIQNPFITQYYVGVYCHEQSHFVVEASSPVVRTRLSEGVVSAWNHVPKNYYRYYYIDGVKKTKDVYISLRSFYGDPDLFISQKNIMPTATDYTWSSRRGSGSMDSVSILRTDPEFISDKLYIGILGYREAFFQIIYYQTETQVVLNDGDKLPGAVRVSPSYDEEHYTFYKFVAPPSSWGSRYTVSFSLQIFGNSNNTANMYASDSTNERPDRGSHKWASYTKPMRITVLDSYDSTFYISVLGTRSSSPDNLVKYVITARTDSQYLDPNGFSVHEVAPKGRMMRFTTSFEEPWFTEQMSAAVISVTLISGKTKLFVSTDGSIADETNYNFRSDSWPGNTVIVPIGHPRFNYSKWSFSVFSEEDSEYFVRSIARQVNLQEGIPALAVTPQGENATIFNYYIPGEWGMEPADNHIINIRLRSGVIKVFGAQDYIPDSRNYNFTVKLSQTSNPLLLLRKERLKSGSLYLAVYANKDHGSDSWAEYEILAQPQSMPRYLVHDQAQRGLILSNDDSNYFRVLNSANTAKKVYAEVQVCDRVTPPKMYLSTINEKPSQNNYTLQSYAKNRFTTVIEGEIPAGISSFYIGVHPERAIGQTSYQMFLTTGEDLRPKPKSKSLIKDYYYAKEKLEFYIPPCSHPLGKKLFYSVYKAEVVLSDGQPPTSNMNSPCGVTDHGSHWVTLPVVDSGIVEKISIPIMFGKIYLINVVAHDEYGLSTAYTPVWVVRGHMYEQFPGEYPRLPVSIGAVFIVLLCLGFSFYLICGVVFKVAKGGRGINVVPNIEFWKDLPYLVLDGIMFVALCGKSSNGFTKFDDENSIDTTENNSDADVERSTNSTSGGYGAI